MRRLASLLATAFISLGVIWAALFLLMAPEMPETADLWRVKQSPGITVLAADGGVLEQRGAFNGVLIDVSQMPPHLPRAVIATEDRRFYHHFGMDIIGFGRAMLANFQAGRVVQGGSTISQQLAKNLFLTPDRTVLRKIRELMLSLWLEARLTKDDILTLYLNRVYLGAGAYGVEAAAQRYFGKSARQVNLQEAAMLAGLLKAPSRYAPTNDLKLSRDRAAQVLQNMVAAGYIDEKQAAAARKAPARLMEQSRTASSRYFVDWVEERLPLLIGNRDEDLIVLSTFDPRLQRLAEASVNRLLAKEGKRRGVGQGAVVMLGHRGAVRVMVGGQSYAGSQFNRAVQAQRQPGSAFKPFVYLAGLEAGLRPDTVLRDSPVTVDGWTPGNFSNKYLGDITLRDALARSVNTVTVKVASKAGRNRVVDTARRLGITSPITPHASSSLGVSEVSLLELTSAYAPFANGGQAIVPHGILEVRTRDGSVIYRRDDTDLGHVIAPAYLDAMNGMLREVVTRGTGRAAALADRPVAGKTGTSQNHRDAWFVGYSADFVTGVWLGNDNDSPTKRVTGGQLPAALWQDIMAQASKGLPARPIPTAPAAIARTQRPAAPAPAGEGLTIKRFVEGIAGILANLPYKPLPPEDFINPDSD
ncbi:MAG: PBP1A family penicillin-binding protein [Alphaproteobacteria bacterium]